jgi:hypothetical protein
MRSAAAQPWRDVRWGLGGHVGAPNQQIVKLKGK